MCPWSLELNISSASFLHFWQEDSRKSQDLAWAACSVPRKADQAATNSEFCAMQDSGTECGLSIGFDAFLLSIYTNRMLVIRVSLCLCPPGRNSGISNKSNRIIWRWFAGGSQFFIGRPYHWRSGRRLCISERFANRICLQLCLNGGKHPNRDDR